jgi:hypothetical protein
MGKEIHLNAFDMNCVGHQSPGLWRHPKDRSATYKDLEYWFRQCVSAAAAASSYPAALWFQALSGIAE